VRESPRDWAWRRQVAAAAISLAFLLPLVFMLAGSLRLPGLPPPRTPELVPRNPSLEAYRQAFDLVDLARYTANSLLVAALVVPLFAIFRALGLTDTYWPLVAPALIGFSPFYVLLFYWSFRRVPRELVEAARLEGFSPLRTWWRVAMPLVRPVTTAVALLAFVFSWGNFLDPLVYVFDERLFTLPLGLRSLAQLDRQNFPVLLAGSVAATLPVLVAFAYLQRFFLAEGVRARWLGRG
jgi:multiple sugar transport system permease protein